MRLSVVLGAGIWVYDALVQYESNDCEKTVPGESGVALDRVE
jgi:hypothetical protein